MARLDKRIDARKAEVARALFLKGESKILILFDVSVSRSAPCGLRGVVLRNSLSSLASRLASHAGLRGPGGAGENFDYDARPPPT